MWTWKFWKHTIERAIKTLAQTAAATIAGTSAFSELAWDVVIGASAMAALLSVLTSVASANIGPDDELPSMV